LLAGKLGGIYRRKYLLSLIYTLRTIVAVAFIMLPPTPFTVIVFSLSMGALWLATVPLTSGLVGYLYGMKYMGTLYGFIFLSHQLWRTCRSKKSRKCSANPPEVIRQGGWLERM